MDTKSINIAVAESVAKIGSAGVVAQVVDKLANIEVAKRADALAAAIKLAEDILKEQRKASKPDQVFISVDGTKTETFSAKAYENIIKLNEKAAKIDRIVNSATENGNWGELYNLVKGSVSFDGLADKPKTNDDTRDS